MAIVDGRIFEEDLRGEIDDDLIQQVEELQAEFGRPRAEIQVISLSTGEVTDEKLEEEEVGKRAVEACNNKENILLQFKCVSGDRCPVPGEWHDIYLVFDGRIFLNEHEVREQIKKTMRSRIISIGMEDLTGEGEGGAGGGA